MGLQAFRCSSSPTLPVDAQDRTGARCMCKIWVLPLATDLPLFYNSFWWTVMWLKNLEGLYTTTPQKKKTPIHCLRVEAQQWTFQISHSSDSEEHAFLTSLPCKHWYDWNFFFFFLPNSSLHKICCVDIRDCQLTRFPQTLVLCLITFISRQCSREAGNLSRGSVSRVNQAN